ncbi:MAG: phosphoribosylglycinamide formyltransferase [Verrucomicrobiota bacterium]
MHDTSTSALLKLGILGSGRGSNFVAIADSIAAAQTQAEIVLVASDFADAPILDAARERGLKTYACRAGNFKTKLEPEIETELAQALQDAQVDLVVLAGFMRVVKAPLLKAFPQRIINVHPSLLPKYRGLEAWRQALEGGEKETGCTVHWVNEILDGGAIIDQRTVPILASDTSETLHARIQVQEHLALPEVIQQISLGNIKLG